MSEMSTLPENSTFSHSWTITDLSGKLVSSVEHPCITSLSFPSTSPNTKSAVFRLSLYPKGINVNFSDFLSIGFGAVSLIKNDEKITVRYRVSLINSKGKRCFTKEWLYIFSSSKRLSIFGRFIARSELFCPSNGLLTDDKLVLHCEGTVLGEPTALDYANTNLTDLKFIASSQPNLMVDMLFNLATKHRLTYYSPECVPNLEIQNQVDETFSYSYKAKMYDDQIFTWSQSKYMKSTEELKLLLRREMLDLLNFWMTSGKHADLSLVLQGDDNGEKVLNGHKIVLLNRSSAFDVLLQNSRVTLPDVPSEVFDQLIHYLYTGKMPLLKQYRYELLAVSCEYDLDALKQICELSICDQIISVNAIYMLILYSAVSRDLLKRAIIEYITEHATERMLVPDLPISVESNFLEKIYLSLALKYALNELEDRKVFENLQTSILSNGIEESHSYTRLKMHHFFNEIDYTCLPTSCFGRGPEYIHPDEMVTIKCGFRRAYNFKIRSEMTLLCGISTLSPNRELTQLAQSRKHLFECFGRLFQDNHDDGDVTLVVHETEFKVHGIFLAQSPLLNTLLVQFHRIYIPDLSIEAFESFVQYLYMGKVQSLDKYAEELLIVASRYKLELLEQMCNFSLNRSDDNKVKEDDEIDGIHEYVGRATAILNSVKIF